MLGVIPPLPQYAFIAWYLFKAQGHLYLYLLTEVHAPFKDPPILNGIRVVSKFK
jgi:hypothetical protein